MKIKKRICNKFFNKEGEWESEIIFLEKDRVEVKFLKKKQANNFSKKLG